MAEAQLDPAITSMITKVVQDSIGLSAQISQLTAENVELKARIYKLENKADASEQYSRRNNLRFFGVSEERGEDTDNILSLLPIERGRRRKKLKSKLKECGHNKVFFNEDLTKTRANLLFHARGLAKSGRVEGAWSSDGSILVRVKHGDSFAVKRIDCIDDLNQFKSYADIARSPAPVGT
ncbi:hypothetical protein MAR_006005 [Mya arenaria]|uniref:Uncharacterized protein n=1 Tax=Mya arenaria TaxID=6604 RepID=A0ABY7D832_MYAAR|nr:hypothetical protein MAR_006005 [Mya arenaria]